MCLNTQIRIDSAALGLGDLPGVGGVGDDGDGAPFAMAWKAVWMALMICCAARQLLSCIQVRKLLLLWLLLLFVLLAP